MVYINRLDIYIVFLEVIQNKFDIPVSSTIPALHIYDIAFPETSRVTMRFSSLSILAFAFVAVVTAAPFEKRTGVSPHFPYVADEMEAGAAENEKRTGVSPHFPYVADEAEAEVERQD